MGVCRVCNDLFDIFGAIMVWLGKSHILSFTLHKLFPSIVVRLCLLVIKHSVSQTALETKALYP